MDLNFTKSGDVRVGMTNYIKNMVNNVSETLETSNKP